MPAGAHDDHIVAGPRLGTAPELRPALVKREGIAGNAESREAHGVPSKVQYFVVYTYVYSEMQMRIASRHRRISLPPRNLLGSSLQECHALLLRPAGSMTGAGCGICAARRVWRWRAWSLLVLGDSTVDSVGRLLSSAVVRPVLHVPAKCGSRRYPQSRCSCRCIISEHQRIWWR